MRTALLSLGIAALCPSMLAQADAGSPGWACRNLQFEIGCSGGTCSASDDFTPMDVHVSREEMDVCAYTGCWAGRPSVAAVAGGIEVFAGQDLAFSTSPDSTADIAVSIETKSGAATILVGGTFATPATCQQVRPHTSDDAAADEPETE